MNVAVIIVALILIFIAHFVIKAKTLGSYVHGGWKQREGREARVFTANMQLSVLSFGILL